MKKRGIAALKQAMLEAQRIELSKFPAEDELANTHVFSTIFNTKMTKLIAENKKKYVYILNKQIHKAAVASLIFVILLSSAMSVEAFRKPVIDFFIEIYEKFSHISFESEEEIELPDAIEKFYTPEQIPDGYSLLKETDYFTSYELIYSNGVYDIIFEQFVLKGTSLGLDTEGTNLKEVNINGFDGLTYTNKNITNIMWNDGEYGFIVSGREDFSILENMAKSIKIKN